MKLDFSQIKKDMLRPDSTTFSLVGANILVIMLALVFQWEFSSILWAYWAQSIIIGFFTFVRLWVLDTSGQSKGEITVMGKKREATSGEMKIFTSLFFVVHYGAFHLAYLAFIGSLMKFDWNVIIWSGAIFFFNHLYSFIKHFKRDCERKLGQVMFAPYLRIVPMHLTIVFGFIFLGWFGMIIFMILKTFVDVGMHQLEHGKSAVIKQNKRHNKK